MTLDDLNQRVTAAILAAERAKNGVAQEAAYREVSLIEEEIAALTNVADIEGVAARLGSITAALQAGMPLRAKMLLDRYRGEAFPERARQKLSELEVDAACTASSGLAW